MAETEVAGSSASHLTFEMAEPISRIVDLLEVTLDGCSAESGQWPAAATLSLALNTGTVATRDENDPSFFIVNASLSLAASESQDSKVFFQIAARFRIKYSLSILGGIEQRNLDAFAMYNGLYNVWPYWREFVQSTSARMGMPPIVLPVYRIGPEGSGLQVEPITAVSLDPPSA
jgi:preprotein translocase subunit SecB